MSERGDARTNGGKTIDQDGHEVLDPKKALVEQALAVDLAGVEIDRAIATAHKYPRTMDKVVSRIQTMATYNQESAESCVYSLPRGGKPIIGASIGFANIVLQSWGNCRAASQIVFVDTKQKVVIAQGAFMDLETNAQSVTPVNRRIVDSKGRLYNDDMIIVTGMAAASIARRNAILNGVPRGIWFPIWQQALELVRGTIETFVERKEKALKAFAQFGVKPEQVILSLGLKGELDLTLEHIPHLRGMYAALRDGSETVETMFDPRRMTGKGFETVENPLGDDVGEVGPGNDDAPTPPRPATKPAGKTAATPKNAAPARQEPPPAPEPPPAQNNAQAGAPEPAAASSESVATPADDPPLAAAAEAAPSPAQAPAPSTTGNDLEAKLAALKTEDEYLNYWEEFCVAATSESQIMNRWSADRNLRGRCSVISKSFDAAKDMKEARIAELRGAKG